MHRCGIANEKQMEKSAGVATSLIVFAFAALVVSIVFASRKSSTTSSQQAIVLNTDFKGATVDWSSADVLGAVEGGNKKALLFGLNYTGTQNELKGCVEDVRNLGQVLRDAGFTVELCTDESAARPSLSVMQSKLAAFLLDLAPNDIAVIWYSGHGVLLSDGENAWVPLDFKTHGFLDETWVRANLAAVAEGVRVFIGCDACHSGTSFDLKFDLEPKLVSTLSSSFKAVAKTRSVSRKNLQHKDLELNMEREFEILDMGEKHTELSAHVVVVSASRDDQTSAEAFQEGEFQGAMTWAFIDALEAHGSTLSLGALQDFMRAQLAENGFVQIPQLSFSRLFSPLTTLNAFGF